MSEATANLIVESVEIGKIFFESTQVKFEEDLGQKIIPKEIYRQINPLSLESEAENLSDGLRNDT